MYSNPAEGSWGSPAPYMVQMVPVPVMGGSGSGPGSGPGSFPAPGQSLSGPMNFSHQGGGYFGGGGSPGGDSARPPAMQSAGAGFKYPYENIVMVSGQYREVRPAIAQTMFAGGHHFRCEPADLPKGLQLDPVTGTIWGTPVPNNMDPAGPYRQYTVVLSSASGTSSCKIGIKVVQFTPDTFNIAHISQLEKSKYMVLVDTRRK
eukprot:TRINITY_DN24878_c0_g1_i1.p3 TRINITY_DN24878_c0_g1~~TRINITY_DN24878_c0_g1_i1.p3  ORF type:complete len:204 (-),score=35.73 TRINITY_DN24878_c0_g1_i1:91-702(-)